jgi:hypothetical protein
MLECGLRRGAGPHGAMSPLKSLVPIPHRRVPSSGDETVFVCTRLGVLNGQELGQGAFERRVIYRAAKLQAPQQA